MGNGAASARGRRTCSSGPCGRTNYPGPSRSRPRRGGTPDRTKPRASTRPTPAGSWWERSRASGSAACPRCGMGRSSGSSASSSCVPEYRGRGYGGRIWAEALARLAGRTVGLDGVPQMEEAYRRSGFRSAYAEIRFCREPGVGGGGGARRRAAAPGSGGAAACVIRPAAEVPRDTLLAYDRRCFPAERAAFLDCWLKLAQSTALCALRDGRLCGYGMIRACQTGHKIGPLFADDADVAAALFAGLLRVGPGRRSHLPGRSRGQHGRPGFGRGARSAGDLPHHPHVSRSGAGDRLGQGLRGHHVRAGLRPRPARATVPRRRLRWWWSSWSPRWTWCSRPGASWSSGRRRSSPGTSATRWSRRPCG